MSDTFSLLNGTRGTLPRVPFSRIKDAVMGERYTLSLAIVGEQKIRILNRTHRGKDMPTDVLSFPYSKTDGEIIINPNTARKKAKQFGMTERHYLAFIFIHGLLHLKGLEHGRTMETQEDTWCRTFSVPSPRQ